MRTLIRFLLALGAIVVGLIALGLVVGGFVYIAGPLGIMLLLFLMLGAGWLLYAFLRYRQARQEEVLHVLATAVEANLPLAPAVRAYLRDRPHRGEGTVWDALLIIFLFPGFWVWYQRYGFDRRVTRLADHLDSGVSLPDALRAVRGVVPREVKVAAAVGEATGRLATCLRRADRDRLAGAWVEVVPRLLYPLLLLLFISGIVGFLMNLVMPRMARILDDFGEPLPEVTERLIAAWEDTGGFLGGIPGFFCTVLPVAVVLAAVLIAVPAARWRLPVFGRLYRWEVQGLVLRMLGALIDVGRPVPEALDLLATAPDVPALARRRLGAARRAVERGDPLAAALRRARLLPAGMVPLVQSAERTRTLPWALAELGELLSGRAVRLARRVSVVLAPVLVVAVGLLVGFIVIGMFMPLIQLLTRLANE